MEKKKPFYKQVADQLIEQLKQGTAPWQKPWDTGQLLDRMPHNAISGRRYRGINNLWLQAQGRGDPRWMTYKQAAAIGAQVRRGEKGTVVEYWKFTEEVNKTDETGREVIGANGEPEKVTVKLERPKVFHAVVFNAEQIDGLPPLQPRLPTWDPNQRAENILAASGANIIHKIGDRAFYSPRSDSITLPAREQFPDQSRYYATALHELGHWTGHEERLNRDLSGPFGSESYAREELRAEISSMLMSQEIGIPFDPGQHASYVASWISVLENDPMEIMRAAADAEKIQSYVVALEQQQTVGLDVHQESGMYRIMTREEKIIDEVAWSEEARIIRAVADGSLIEEIRQLATQADESAYTKLYAIQNTLEAMASLNPDGPFWQRHEMPPEAIVDTFSSNFGLFRYQVGEEVSNLYDTIKEREGDRTMNSMVPNGEGREKLQQEETEQVKVVSDKITHVYIPFADKEKAKALGAKWDGQEKSWYIPPGVNQEPFRQWLDNPVQKAQTVTEIVPAAVNIFIQVPYTERNEAKALGAKWDKAEKSWYIPEGVNTLLFDQWRASEQAAEIDTGHQVTEVVSAELEAVMQELTLERETETERAAEMPVPPGNVSAEKVFLAVAYEERNGAKALGAKWDKEAKSWYMDADNPNLAAAKKWLPENQIQESMPAMSPVEEFADKLREMGCIVEKGHPFMDGQKHRIETVGDKKGERSGFYVGHLDGHPAGYIKNNRTGEEVRWKAKGYSLSAEEKARLAAEAAQKLQVRQEQKQQAQNAAVERIKYYMKDYRPVEVATPYLAAKGIQPQAGIFTDRSGEKTFIPVHNADGELRSMQYIQADGTKRFAKDSEQEGCMHVVGGKDLALAKTIILSEGYATAATLAEATDESVVSVAAFNSGNLPVVAKALAERYPQAQFLVAGDDDLAIEVKYQKGNPGRDKAQEAAKILNCQAIFPIFAAGEQSAENKMFTDFNDLAQRSKLGKAGVAKQINEALLARSPQELQTLQARVLKMTQSSPEAEEQSRQHTQNLKRAASRSR